jgi:hypothetical protein
VSGTLIVPGVLVVEDVMLLVLHEEVGPPATAPHCSTCSAAWCSSAWCSSISPCSAGSGRLAPRSSPSGTARCPMRCAHDIVARRPGPARSLVPELGAELWRPVIGRLVERGRIRRGRRRPLGLHPVTTRAVADARHEADLQAHLRTVQESGRRPGARTAAVLALLSASGALPNLGRAAPVVDVAHTALSTPTGACQMAVSIH